MKLFCNLFTASAILIALFLGCSKDQGATGPAGPQGGTGAQGNANVKPVRDSTNSSSNWTYVPGNGWYADFVDPTLSASFISSGGIAEVFLSTDGGKAWNALPLNYYPYTDSTLNAQMSYFYYLNTVQVAFNWSDQKQHTDPVTTFSSTCSFNIVCIAPAIVKKYPQTNWSDYKSVSLIPELSLSFTIN